MNHLFVDDYQDLEGVSENLNPSLTMWVVSYNWKPLQVVMGGIIQYASPELSLWILFGSDHLHSPPTSSTFTLWFIYLFFFWQACFYRSQPKKSDRTHPKLKARTDAYCENSYSLLRKRFSLFLCFFFSIFLSMWFFWTDDR